MKMEEEEVVEEEGKLLEIDWVDWKKEKTMEEVEGVWSLVELIQ